VTEKLHAGCGNWVHAVHSHICEAKSKEPHGPRKERDWIKQAIKKLETLKIVV